jgi:uncharacterized protein DUF4242
MKRVTVTLIAVLLVTTLAAIVQSATASAADAPVHRYLVERSFPAGALDGLDAALKAKVNANNAKFGVHWLMSYANATKTKTYCIYEGPDAAAVRNAAAANKLPVDSITEVPVTLLPK